MISCISYIIKQAAVTRYRLAYRFRLMILQFIGHIGEERIGFCMFRMLAAVSIYRI